MARKTEHQRAVDTYAKILAKENPKALVVKYSEILSHGHNLSAEFWLNHDKKKCKICKITQSMKR